MFRRPLRSLLLLVAALITLAPPAFAQNRSLTTPVEFPAELVRWSPCSATPAFTAQGPGQWEVKIRERGWILREGDLWHLWFTGYDGTREGQKQLGYATSRDGRHWMPWPRNPLNRDQYIEDMMVVKQGDLYYMFAEGIDGAHLVMLTSRDGIDWNWEGPLDIRLANGRQPAPEPRGTPTVWIENGKWHLFYESRDLGVWLAKTVDPHSRIWSNVQDEPVLMPGPAAYDNHQIALDQIIKYGGAYYASYHSCSKASPTVWSTNIARSTDLVHWQKYPGNPLIPDKSSAIVVPDGNGFRLYTMHGQVEEFCSNEAAKPVERSAADRGGTRAASPAALP